MARHIQQPLLAHPAPAAGPVTCLGSAFENDNARRDHFTEKLRAKLRDPEFRKIEGFPTGDDEDILTMSDPPYYTACPNPFLFEFVEQQRRANEAESRAYHREPMAVDVSEGKTDSLYSAHPYHTKVPHKAIIRAILHYTEPNDLVLDGFAGSGMTGVAAQMCGCPDSELRATIEQEWKANGRDKPPWGLRNVILNDLSPYASFIAGNFNLPFDVDSFSDAGESLLQRLNDEFAWMYTTSHEKKSQGQINFTVWSESFSCPECGEELVFIRESLNTQTKKTRSSFPCPHCAAKLTKKSLDRLFTTLTDPANGKPWSRIKLVPVFCNYSVGSERFQKELDAADLAVLDKIAALPFPPRVPTDRFPLEKMYHGSRLEPKGFTHIHHMFLPQAAQWLGSAWEQATQVEDRRLRNVLLFFVEQAMWTASILNRYRPTGYSQVNQHLTGVYYVPSQHAECSPRYVLGGKLSRLAGAFARQYATPGAAMVSTGSATQLGLPDDSVDYIFTDPPFGANIPYADLNILVETWHRVVTSPGSEAVVDPMKGKGLPEYQRLMQRCFEEYCRVLKPGRWMTMVFHNSHNAVWNCIQEAMTVAGFVVADVRTLDKQQGSYRQVTSTAVKQDLVVTAYKPNGGLEKRFRLVAGTEETVWEFVATHLAQLPVFVAKDGKAEMIAERQDYLLFDRMVAFHVQRGVTVPMSAAEFHAGLSDRFPERDGMYFLLEQLAEYDKKRTLVEEVIQLEFFVTNEATAIRWLRQLLDKKPQPTQSIRPQFMKELAGWQKYEKSLELAELLEQSFLHYDGKGPVPSQIHKYLSSNFHELRKLDKDDPKLVAKAKDRWYVPDPHKEADVEKIRQRALMKEFGEYRESKGRLTKVRTEALKAGFQECYRNQEYDVIVAMANRISDTVIQEDVALLMYYDNAVMLGGE